MADPQKVEKDGRLLDDDTLEFCKKIYEESSERVDQLRDVNVENYEFYEGIDERLTIRESDPNVKRSSLFVHQLTPAIDTRIGEIVAKMEERERPVILTPKNKEAEGDERDQIALVEEMLNRQLRESGYLSDVFLEQSRAAEIYETPAAVAVGWRTDEEEYAEVVEPSESDLEDALVTGEIPKPRVVYRQRDVGEPYVEFIPPDELLYEPGVSLFEKDSQYIGRRQYKHKWEILSLAKQYGWKVKKVEKFFEEEDTAKSGDAKYTEAIDKQVEADRGTPLRDDPDAEKTLLVQWWIVRYTDSGKREAKHIVVLGNKVIIHEKSKQYRGFDFPFVLLVPNRKIGSIENIPTVTRGKPMQRIYNEIFNSYLDGVTYRIFPPFKKRNGNNFTQQPIYGPGQMWTLDDPEDLVPVIENPGMLPDLPALMASVGAQIRDVSNAQDFQQGFNAQPYEKATSARLRALGAARRATPSHKVFGLAIKEVARKFILLNQQFAEDGWRWVVDVDIDVPSLTNVTDPEQEKQDALLIHSQMLQDPMYQSPAGLRKRRNAWEKVIRSFYKSDAEMYFLSQDDLENDIDVNTEMQKTMIDKQSIAEAGAVIGQTAGAQ